MYDAYCYSWFCASPEFYSASCQLLDSLYHRWVQESLLESGPMDAVFLVIRRELPSVEYETTCSCKSWEM